MTLRPARQAELFEKPRRPPPRVMMHVCDAGEAVQFECGRCGFKSVWYERMPLAEERRGIPCPKCNRDGEATFMTDGGK